MSGERLEELIYAAGFNQSTFAKEANLTRSCINRYINGSIVIPSDFAQWADSFLRQKAAEKMVENATVLAKVA